MAETIKVLMVDDEAQFRTTTEKLLRRRGFDIVLAANGKEAIAKMVERPDVVVLDVKMPDMDGHETLKEIHKIRPAQPVVMLTGHGGPTSAQQAYEEGALNYLTKPCDIHVLTEAIREAFRRGTSKKREKEKTVAGIMVPIEEYTLLDGECTVAQAIAELKASFALKHSTSRLMETGHRSVLVVDKQRRPQGFLAITNLLKMILPSYLSAPKPSMADSVQYSPMFWDGMFAAEVRHKASMKIKDIMSPEPFTIDAGASLMEAAYMMVTMNARRVVVMQNGDLAGVVREQDLFFEMDRVLQQA